MIIKRLKLENWRNYLHQEALFDESVNIIYGANAQGCLLYTSSQPAWGIGAAVSSDSGFDDGNSSIIIMKALLPFYF